MFKIQLGRPLTQKCIFFPLFCTKATLGKNLPELRLMSIKSSPEIQNFARKSQWMHAKDESSPKETEQEFLVRAKIDPDRFGEPYTEEQVFEDEGDAREEKYLQEKPSPHKRLRTKQYADIIKDLIRKRKIKEAIDVVEVRMLKEDRVKPENYLYNLLLGACGRVGYTKKAFMLYNDMKKRGLKVTGGTYTALFNACANSPWPNTDGLTRAKHLYDIMIEKGDQPNDTNYNAMIKAFGRCGDLPMAFSLVDDMAQKGFCIRDDTINFLLQACISDKESGFRHSLLVWRKLIEKNIQPSLYTFNLLLRSVRDCNLGDSETTRDVIGKILDENSMQEPRNKLLDGFTSVDKNYIAFENEKFHTDQHSSENCADRNLFIKEGQNDVDTDKSDLVNMSDSSSEKSIEYLNLRPNLLAQKPHLGSIVSLSEVKKPEDRLLLVGGCKGFLEIMSQFNCTPDIKTFTQLLDCIPSTLAAEKELIVAMRKANIKPDIDFYNMLIKKRGMRCDYAGAKEILASMKQMKMRPDLITYGVLAISCSTKEEALDLLSEMKKTGYTLNAAILGAMLKQACFHMQYDYIFEIMEMCLRESVPVNKKFLEHLETFKEKQRAKLDAKELNKKEVKMFGIFKARQKTWLTEVQIDDSEQTHPWQQFRQYSPENTRYRPKDAARFKPRHTSQFKVKTSTKVRY